VAKKSKSATGRVARKDKTKTSKRLVPLAGGFDPVQFLTTAGSGRTQATYKARSTIFRQDDACTAVYYIVEGQVQLNVISRQGKERAIAILGPDSFVGEGGLAGHPQYFASARAITKCTVTRVTNTTMKRLINEHPEMSQLFMSFILNRSSQIEADLIDQLFNSSEKRLARLLLLMARVGKEATTETITVPLTQETMAARIGTTRSRINYFLNKFRKLGLIEYNGTLKVHSSLMNIIVSD
jgi:CRP-like cAMP-binding protein